ncbi:MAG TPA: Wzz/FepE/Etk N-terminal domain-containing protein [Thermoanaerobaculia bacterium]|nr:Wzz/FepE/Etk N-terminal domain-containing protein [Thermoanaerobaculia bacterium]
MALNGSNRNAPARDLHDGVSLRALVNVLRRRKLLVVAIALPVIAAFVAAAFLLPPTYEAEALIEFEPSFEPGHDHGAVPHDLTVQHQLPRIQDVVYRRSLLERVIHQNDLFPESPGAETAAELTELKSRIGIRVVGERTFELGYEDRDPQRVVRVTSDLSRLLLATTRTEREQRAEASSEFIEAQIEPVKARLQEQERAIEEYKSRWITEIPEQVPTSLKLLETTHERMAGVSKSISDDEARRVAILRELSELERQGVNEKAAKSPAEARLDELRMELRQLERRYTDRHPEVVRARSEIEELERAIAQGGMASAAAPEPSPLQVRSMQLRAELDAVGDRLESARRERQALLAESGSYQSRVEAAPRHEAALAALHREYTTTQEQYHSLLERLRSSRLAEDREKTQQGGVFRIVEPPRVPAAPASPNRLRLILMGLLAGLGLGVGAAFLTEQVDPSFRDVDDVESSLRLPVLAAVPKLPDRSGRRWRRPAGAGIALLDDPENAPAEQYRILATRLVQQAGASGASPRDAILVTSPLGSEGKTTTAINLALALAQRAEGKVLLVDADVARPSVHRFLDIPPGNGFSKLLEDPDADPRRYARWHEGLWLVEAGREPAEGRTALATPAAQRAFQRLRQRFRYVVVDAPPVLALAEGLILQDVVDSILLVVRARKTPREAVLRAVRSLDGERLAGVVLNGADPASAYSYAYPYPRHRPRAMAVAGGPRS